MAKSNMPKKMPLENFLVYVLNGIQFAKLDGVLHYYNGKYYVPLNSHVDVKKVIYQKIPEVLSYTSLKTLGDCANVIFQLQWFPDKLPAEVNGWLGFANGIYYYRGNYNENIYSNFTYFTDGKRILSNDFLITRTEQDNRFLNLNDQEDLNRYNRAVSQVVNDQRPIIPIPQEDLPVKITHLLTAEWVSFPFDMSDGNKADYRLNVERLAPITDHFFKTIAGNDQDLIERIWEVLACILVPDPTIKKFFLLSGVPDSGKSVLGNFIKGLFSKENVVDLDFERLGDRFSTSSLSGAYLNLSMDLPNRPISTKTIAVLKQLTGDDDITVEAKFQDAASFKNRSRFLFATNHPLQLTRNDTAFLNRLVVIPFRHKVADSEKDFSLLSKLSTERDIVASIAVRFYYPQIKEKNFVFTGSERADFQPVIKYSRNYKKTQEDQIYQFVMTYCRITGKKEDFAYTEDVFKSYQDFCGKEGLDEPCDIKQFSRILGDTIGSQVEKRRLHTSQKIGEEIIEKNQYAYCGMQLLTEPFTEYQ